MVNTPPENVPVTPAGKPVTVTLVAPLAVVYTILVIAVLIQPVWFAVPAADVKVMVTLGFTVMVPLSEAVPQPPEVVTV